jgi:F-type H+-transporting ATPase subunit b
MPTAEAWVALAFVSFLGLLAYLGAHRKVIDTLDRRRERIRAELHEAARLREEAQGLLVEFQRKASAAETEAMAIIGNANAEAQRIAAEAQLHMEHFIALRIKIADSKIAQAEAKALADVRAAAADAAAAAAEKILQSPAVSDSRNFLLTKSIGDVRIKLDGAQSKIGLDAAE